MVEQMITPNLSKYGLGKCASITATSTTTTAAITTASEVRDVQNNNKIPGSSFIEEAQAKSLPGTNSANVNRNLVYARRKYDAETSNSDKNQTTYQHVASDKKESFAENSIAATPTRIKNEQTMGHWNARFGQLHNYLHHCDTPSQQDVYLQKFRSLSPDKCNKHAVELERRAIHLTMQEGTEIKRVKDLNVLGKSGGSHVLLRLGR